MIIRKAFSGKILSGCVRVILIRFLSFLPFFVAVSLPYNSFAQTQQDFDEVPVFLNVPRLGGMEITVVIRGAELYLPITDLFEFLKIRNVTAPGLESVSGFFINPEAVYLINHTDNLIRYQDKTINLDPGDLIKTESNLYLRSSFFGKVFGLDCVFNFRSLSLTLNSKLELPLIREMRLEEMRKNLTRLKGEEKADTSIGRSYPLFRFGMADWSVIGNEEVNGKSDVRLNLNLGSMIAGGEATVALNYNSTDPFLEKQQYYLWRYVDNDFKALRQVMAGKIAANPISTLNNPVLGIQLTNTPTTYRRSFGSYTLSDKTEPGWVVELYVNNVLVDYVKADASGFFTFEVPLVYGNSNVKLKFFSPWGEERVKEQYISIPFNFLPKNTMEYNVSAGFVEDSLFSKFSRAVVNYGITRHLTVGTGIEYLSSVKSGPTIPFFNASMSVFNNLLLSGEYAFGVRSKGTLSYRLPSNIQLDLNYTKYDKDQKAIIYNYLEERKATLSVPLRIKNFYTYQRFSVYQIVVPLSKYTTGEWMLSGSIFGVSTNLTTYGLFMDANTPTVYSNLSLALRLPSGFVIMPQAQYSFTRNSFLSAKVALEKHLFTNAYLNMSYEQNFSNKFNLAEAGFRYDFSFAQTGVSVRQNDKRTSLTQYARGSLIHDKSTKYMGADNRTNVGKGGISVIPYLDLNANGIRDAGEPKAFGLNLRANGGRIEKSERDTTIRILGLEPYTTCFVELDPGSFENVSWRLPVKTLSVSVDPNILKHIEIPITVVGEASGNVTISKDGETKGLGRIIVCFFSASQKPVGKTLTEDDGYFNYFGLAPGEYIVRIDTNQLKKLGMSSDPLFRQFKIRGGADGDMVEGLDFMTSMQKADTTVQKAPEMRVIPVMKKDTTRMIVHEVAQELVTIAEDSYAIQLGAFKNKKNADALRRKLEKLLGRKVEIITEGDFYKVRIDQIKERKEVDEVIAVLQKNGINEIWLISLKAKKQQWIVTQKQDTLIGITETRTDGLVPLFNSDLAIQAGAFRRESNALDLRRRLSSEIDKQIEIVKEGGFYKVRVLGFKDPDEMKNYLPVLRKYGVKDLWILPVSKKPDVQPPAVLPDTIKKIIEVPKEVPVIAKPDSVIAPVEEKVEEPVIPPPGPTVSLQVAIFYKQSQANRAKRKIESKLNLPVEIVRQWEYYRVIVTGFYTREETYKYYPELAGLGYPSIMLIEKK